MRRFFILPGFLFCAVAAFGQLRVTGVTGPDVAVSKTGPAQSAADTDVSYDVTLTNVGPGTATGITLQDLIPAGMTFVSVTPSATCTDPGAGNGGTVTCTVATLAENDSTTFTIVLHIPPQTPPGTGFTNIANISSPTDPNGENDTSSATTSTPPPPSSDGSILKDGPTSAAPDSDVPYTITVSNNGPDASATFSWTDTLPGTMTFVSLNQNSGPVMSCTTGTTVTCSASNFPAFTSATFTLTGHIPSGTPAGTVFQNTAKVTATNDPDPENNSAVTSLTVASADMAITKVNAGPGTATAGTPFSYTITVTNNGPDTATNATWTDPLPPNTTFTSLTQNNGAVATGCSTPPPNINGTVTCSWNSLGSGLSAQFTLTITAGNTASVSNTATVSASEFDPNTNNNTANATTTITPSADMTITKSGPSSITQGTDITYTISVHNNGPTDAANVVVSDTYPANTTFGSATPTSGPAGSCTPGPASVSCTFASFPFNATASITLVLHVSNTAPNGSSIANTATVSASTGDPDSNNNSSTTTATVTLAPTADLSVTKNGPATAARGSNITYNLSITNNGPGPSNNVTLTDTFPANTTFVSVNQTSGPTFNCTNTTTTLTCTIATLNAGASAAFDLTLHVTNNATGTITNSVSATSSTPDPTPGNSTATSGAAVTSTGNAPTLSPLALALLSIVIAAMGVLATRR
ncbi:MAG: hypothetical protein DMF56_20775 [Acidobacteria bacterium]|nr:MAG: hypothetical protein DMF56_20775 [Acidobacteriota bacterium]